MCGGALSGDITPTGASGDAPGAFLGTGHPARPWAGARDRETGGGADAGAAIPPRPAVRSGAR
ncbi:hypothetical protein GCM10010327_12790 [Streptomyces nitrosporeus]|nr:hypothetical protein GCM10010327_12790 [Streptomyces nitrosporeus]